MGALYKGCIVHSLKKKQAFSGDAVGSGVLRGAELR